MSTRHLSIALEATVKVPAALTRTVFLDAVYTRAVADDGNKALGDLPNTVQETLRFALDNKLHGSAYLTDAAPAIPIDLLFLSASGSVSLRKSVTPGNDNTVPVTLDAADVSAIAAASPQPPPAVPIIQRRAFFVPVGDARVPFEASKLQIAPLAVGNGGWKALGLDQVFHIDRPITAAVPWNGALWSGSGAIPWTSFHLGVDGSFVFQFPMARWDAWIWWLSGPLSAAGIVLDDLSAARVVPMGVALPPFSGVTAADGTSLVPKDFTEAEVASNPQVYTEDPGEFCKPFKNPERVLGERSFFVISRVEQPVISIGASVTMDPLPTFTYNHSR
jgi:hypothetical protein